MNLLAVSSWKRIFGRVNFRNGVLVTCLSFVVFATIFASHIKAFFTSQTAAINALSLVGTLISLLSFLVALYETEERQKLETKRRSQLWASLDRARYLTFDHEIVKELEKELAHEEKHRLWLLHQAGCDLYISLIEQYLSLVDRFTYEDLAKLVKNGGVHWKWQEVQWRILISQRPENKDNEPPEFFVEHQGSNYRKPQTSVKAV